jgi:hypothetical protein
MDASPNPLTERVARQIVERQAALSPLRECALRAGSASMRGHALLALVLLDHELAGWKEVAARLEQAVRFEPRDHRAIRMPARR